MLAFSEWVARVCVTSHDGHKLCLGGVTIRSSVSESVCSSCLDDEFYLYNLSINLTFNVPQGQTRLDIRANIRLLGSVG